MIRSASQIDRSTPRSTVLAAAATGVVETMCNGRNGGVDVESVFAHARLSVDTILDPYAEIGLKQYCDLFEAASKATDDDNFGLRFGQAFEVQHLGLIGYIAVNAPTLVMALRKLVEYFPTHQTQSFLRVTPYRGLLCLSYQVLDPRIQLRRQDAELSLGMFCNMFRYCLGSRWTPVEIWFEHHKPDHAVEHERCFGSPVKFGERTNGIVFRPEVLETPVPHADPYLLRLLEQPVRAIQRRHAHPAYPRALIAQHVQQRLGSAHCAVADVASDLGMSLPAFKRTLRDNNIQFSAVVKKVRKDLALEYVGSTDMSLTEIALSLGYSEQSALSRAFRCWTGLSPRSYRRARKAAAD